MPTDLDTFMATQRKRIEAMLCPPKTYMAKRWENHCRKEAQMEYREQVLDTSDDELDFERRR